MSETMESYSCEKHLAYLCRTVAKMSKTHNVTVRVAGVGPNIPLAFKRTCPYEDCKESVTFKISAEKNQVWFTK